MVIRIGGASEGAARDLFAALSELYLAAGAPSIRAIADRTHGLSRDTVHRALTGDRPPKWSTLHDIVVALDGDIDQFREQWVAATRTGAVVNVGTIEPTRTRSLNPIEKPDEKPESGVLRVAIVDDHEVVRRGLKELFEDDGFEIAGIAADAPDGVSMVLNTRPDVVIMDIRMPSGNGIDATAEILAQRPETRVLILTSYSDDGAVRDAVRAGAAGFLLKETTGRELIQAVRDVAEGKTYWAYPKAAEFAAEPVNLSMSDERSPRLTARELTVLGLMCDGLTNREIAERLSISLNTTETHLVRLMAKLGTSGSRVKTVLYAIKHRLVAGPG